MKREPAVRAALSKMYRSGKNVGVLHDMKCTGAMHPLSSDVIKVLGLSSSFMLSLACCTRHAPMFADVNLESLTRLRSYPMRGQWLFCVR